MGGITLGALFIRFILGGAAVVASTMIGRKLGEKAGGIFAAFPAVYLAALLTGGLDYKGQALIHHSIILSKGAIIGMAINILVAILAGVFLQKSGWKRGLIHSMACWFVLSFVVIIITSY